MNEQPPKQRFPTWKQALLIFFGGIVLAGSSCAGFILTMFKAGSILPPVFEVGFVLGAVATGLGFVLVLVRAITGPGVARLRTGKPEKEHE